MRTFKWIIPVCFLAFGVSSCIIDIDDDSPGGCVKADGPVTSEILELSRIEGIDLGIPATVFISQGDEQMVEVEAQDDVIDQIETTVRAGIWKIEYDRCVKNESSIRIYITVKELTSIAISGSGEIISQTQLVVDDLDVSIEGSGDIDLELQADDIDANIEGSGSIRFDGIADALNINITGSGDFQCFNLEARKASVNISGSGDAELFVTEQLDVNITGSGDVFYKGGPSLNVSVSGSGGVVDAN
jgi:autotransporter translocation and assembly factor TamB